MNTNRFFAHFGALFDTPAEIVSLRKIILRLAFEGELVEEFSEDEPVRDLLERMDSKRERSGDDGSASIFGSMRFPIPAHWSWSTLSRVATVVGGGTPNASEPENFSEDGTPWVTPADLYKTTNKWVSRGRRSLSKRGLENSSAKILPAGTVLFSSRAPIGHVAIAANEICTNQGFKSSIPFEMEMNEYIYFYLKFAAPAIDRCAPGTTFKEVSGKLVKAIPIPIAPLGEQRRIVEKLNLLLDLCDKLERELRLRDEKKSLLLELAEAEFPQGKSSSRSKTGGLDRVTGTGGAPRVTGGFEDVLA